MKQIYREHIKKCGPGGFKCSCCNPFGGVNKGKKESHRIVRRKLKQDLKKEME